jgi:hypothetical protein
MADIKQVASLPSSLSCSFITILHSRLHPPSSRQTLPSLTGMADKTYTPLNARPAPLSTMSHTQTTHPRRPLTARSSARDDTSADYVVAVIQGRGMYSSLIRLSPDIEQVQA